MYFSSTKEMEQLDDFAVENGLEIKQMMELAGFHMATVFEKEQIEKDSKIAIVCGKGNKGGDGLSAARHLFNLGWHSISVVLASEDIKEDPSHHLRFLKKMSMPILKYKNEKEEVVSIIKNSDVVIDALIGYHLEGAPRGVFLELIELVNDADAKIIAYDMPSGVDATTGECSGVCISAGATLTLALPKKVFQTENSRKHSGKVYLGDIGIPAFLYDKISKNSRPDFQSGVVLLNM